MNQTESGMNWSAMFRRRVWAAPALMVAAACGVPAEDLAADSDPGVYALEYTLAPDPANARFDVTLRVEQSAHLLREVRFPSDPDRLDGFEGDGVVQTEGATVRWFVPDNGGTLSWRAEARRQRGSGGYDAWLGDDFGLLRAERLIPRAVSRTAKGARSRTTLKFDLPPDWSVVTQYRGRDGRFPVDNPSRRYDEPSGWMVLGRLGVRMDDIAGSRVVIAGPTGNDVRRLDMLAVLNWTLPEIGRIAGPLPPRITVVSAGEPMWRGGLAASDSFYIHSDRPLISENGSSTLLHELMHVVLGVRSQPGFDWMIEGIAEFYSITSLSRAGGLSGDRTDKAFAAQRRWASEADVLCADPSKGPRTAMAVTLIKRLDDEIRKATDDRNSFDDVLQQLLADREQALDLARLDEAVVSVLGRPAESLDQESLPGCAESARGSIS